MYTKHLPFKLKHWLSRNLLAFGRIARSTIGQHQSHSLAHKLMRSGAQYWPDGSLLFSTSTSVLLITPYSNWIACFACLLAYFERTRTPLTSFIHSFRFSMMFFSSAMLKPVSFCSWSTYVNAGLPLFLAPCFGSQSSKSLITSSFFLQKSHYTTLTIHYPLDHWGFVKKKPFPTGFEPVSLESHLAGWTHRPKARTIRTIRLN